MESEHPDGRDKQTDRHDRLGPKSRQEDSDWIPEPSAAKERDQWQEGEAGLHRTESQRTLQVVSQEQEHTEDTDASEQHHQKEIRPVFG